MKHKQKILITGASSGFGKSIAKRFLKDDNYEVYGTFNNHAIEELSSENSFRVDFNDLVSIDNFITAIDDRSIKFDIVVNNAAIMPDKNFDDCYTDLLIETLQVNLIGTIFLTEKLLNNLLLSEDCTIVNVSSNLGSMSDYVDEFHPSYRISKAALNMYTRTLASKYWDKPKTIVAIHPGWLKTEMGGDEAPTLPKESAEKFYEMIKNNKFDNGNYYKEYEKAGW